MTTATIELDFLLPGQWSTIPLNDPVVAKRAIRSYALRTLGRADQLAPVRADFRKELEGVAARAVELKASTLHVAREIVTGVPLPATLMICWPDVPAPAQATDRAAWEAGMLAGAGEGDKELVEIDEVRAVRRVVVREGPALGEEGAPQLQQLEVEYWMVVEEKVVIFAFSSGAGQVREHLVGLFDAIISTVRAVQPAREEAAVHL